MGIRTLYADAQLNVPPGKNDVPYATKLELVRSIMSHMSEAAAGSVTGTGAAIEVATPFSPGLVLLFNRTAPCFAMKTPGMAGDDCMKLSGVPALTYVGANGITLGITGTTKGFTIGTDADINTAAEVIEWVAIGFRDQDGSL